VNGDLRRLVLFTVYPRIAVHAHIILAGPNGAGKTTFAREFLPDEAECPAFVNADLIAAGLSPFNPEVVAMRAGRIMLELIDEHVSRGDSFAFETTLAGKSYARHIPHWQAAGYRVTLLFLALPSAEAALQRVRERVAQGGHSIPEAVVMRRFLAGRLDSRPRTSRSSTLGRSTTTRTVSPFC
jgi:predicted ABC-type ATPase